MEPDPQILAQQWQRVGAELDRAVAAYLVGERAALVTTAAVWTVLAATTSVDWDPIVKWLPFVLNVLFAVRGFALIARIGTLERTLAAAEQRLALPADVTSKGRRVGGLPGLVFWLLLLAATAVLPWFYIEQATDVGYAGSSVSSRVGGRPAEPAPVIPRRAATRITASARAATLAVP